VRQASLTMQILPDWTMLFSPQLLVGWRIRPQVFEQAFDSR